ncbi:MAG: LacI family transcriptional regulator [Treponema sp.]|jgi:LacI family transcriptional regulator|nr:LacI family transcriptional regulator [Treponema sp.]
MRRATLADVAAYAGVSPAAVSYYFRGTKKLSSKLEEKLNEGAKILNYTPIHGSIKPERARRIKLINMCVNVENNDDVKDDIYIFCLMNGILECLTEQGYQLAMSRIVEDDQKSRELFIAGLDHSAGVIICNNRKKHHLEDELKERKIPYVLLGAPEKAESDFYVDIDIQGVGYQATEYLLDKGHRRILFLNLAESMLQSQKRREGFLLAYEHRGLEFNDADHVFAPISTETCCRTVIDYIKRDKSYTAIVTANEIQAQGVIRAMRELKIAIPSKMAVISMGGTMLGAITVPSLTTIDFNPHKHGYETARLLLDVLEKKRIQPFHLFLPGTLVERDSAK